MDQQINMNEMMSVFAKTMFGQNPNPQQTKSNMEFNQGFKSDQSNLIKKNGVNNQAKSASQSANRQSESVSPKKA